MIQSKADLYDYFEADRIALRRGRRFGLLQWVADPIWRFERTLRVREYLYNCCRSGFLNWLRWRWVSFCYHRQELKLGFMIPPNCFGPGLCITHVGPIVVNPSARIGKNCEINVCVNIGSNMGCDPKDAPTIGDDCFIGPGAKIFGKITIGNGVAIGANAVVNKSFPQGECILVGVPAVAKPKSRSVIR